ncbi:MAG: bifunctional pyr operon transcriptional regulator/uracil phosphoribosyltransferase PyrR [Chthoniobacterales bacterium]
MSETKKISKETTATLSMDAEAIRKAIRRIAHEIIERHPELSQLVILGIPTHGVEVAKRLVKYIAEIEKVEPSFGVLDISMHRDDLSTRGRMTAIQETQLPLDLDNRNVILVDDVLFTGRTCRAAMDALSSFGRPLRIELAVLVDRGHRELPIRADYVGKNLPTSREEKISVRFENTDGVADSVSVLKS